jgi:hypothetical protein
MVLVLFTNHNCNHNLSLNYANMAFTSIIAAPKAAVYIVIISVTVLMSPYILYIAILYLINPSSFNNHEEDQANNF